jgi:hypothetical protein
VAEVSVRINEVILGCRVTFTDDATELSAEITPLIMDAQEKNGKTTRLAPNKRQLEILFRKLLVFIAVIYILSNIIPNRLYSYSNALMIIIRNEYSEKPSKQAKKLLKLSFFMFFV